MPLRFPRVNGQTLRARFVMAVTGFLAFHSPPILEPNYPPTSTNLAPHDILSSVLPVALCMAGFL